MYLVGTAGHVDHGKSTLVKALTGVDPDRLVEEKRRSLTIELGFAHYIDDDNRVVGIVDVPGHERFIRNMVGGVWSLDVALLVVASDDGWMAQTEDHALVLKGMRVPSILVALTKIDCVEREQRERVKAQIEERYKALFSKEPTIVEVSGETKEGISLLKSEIKSLTQRPKLSNWPSALFVDRSFTMAGHGAVVTGSLRGAPLHRGDEITLLPKNLKGRVRSLQNFTKEVESIPEGNRVAIGLQGISESDIKKGDCITTQKEDFEISNEIFALLHPLYDDRPITIKNQSRVEIASGTWHDYCSFQYINNSIVRLKTDALHPWYYKEPLLLIQPGSSTIKAFGEVLSGRKLSKRELSELVLHTPFLSKIENREYLYLLLNNFALLPNLTKESLSIANKSFEKLNRWWIESSLKERLLTTLSKRLAKEESVALESVKHLPPYPASLIGELVELLIEKGELTLIKGVVHLQREKQRALRESELTLLKNIEAQGYTGYETKRVSKIEKQIVATLLKENLVIIIEGTYLYTTATYQKMVGLILKGKAIGEEFTIQEAREHLSLSRKYMLPLLNQMEREGYLRRIGDLRRVMKLISP